MSFVLRQKHAQNFRWRQRESVSFFFCGWLGAWGAVFVADVPAKKGELGIATAGTIWPYSLQICGRHDITALRNGARTNFYCFVQVAQRPLRSAVHFFNMLLKLHHKVERWIGGIFQLVGTKHEHPLPAWLKDPCVLEVQSVCQEATKQSVFGQLFIPYPKRWRWFLVLV